MNLEISLIASILELVAIYMRTKAIILTLILNWAFLIAESTSIDSLRTDEKLISQLKKQFTLTNRLVVKIDTFAEPEPL